MHVCTGAVELIKHVFFIVKVNLYKFLGIYCSNVCYALVDKLTELY